VGEKTSPTDVGVIKEKLDRGEVKAKGEKQPRKEHAVKGVNGNISDAQVIAFLKTQDSAITSTQLRDGLQFKSRTQARRVMRRLAKGDKATVKITAKQVSDKRQVFMFEAI
jgi:hypothetical protein